LGVPLGVPRQIEGDVLGLFRFALILRIIGTDGVLVLFIIEGDLLGLARLALQAYFQHFDSLELLFD